MSMKNVQNLLRKKSEKRKKCDRIKKQQLSGQVDRLQLRKARII